MSRGDVDVVWHAHCAMADGSRIHADGESRLLSTAEILHGQQIWKQGASQSETRDARAQEWNLAQRQFRQEGD
jgi:hypothetical protein